MKKILLLIFLCPTLGFSQTKIELMVDSICQEMYNCLQYDEKDAVENCFSIIEARILKLPDSYLEEFLDVFEKNCISKIRPLLLNLKNEDSIKNDAHKTVKNDCIPLYYLYPLKNNFLYEDVENPIDLLLYYINKDSFEIKINQGELLKYNDRYSITKLQKGRVSIEYIVNGKSSGGIDIRVKEIPAPVWNLTGTKNFEIQKGNIESLGEIKGIIPDFDFYVVPIIEFFTLKIIRNGIILSETENIGDKFSKKNINLLKQSNVGDVILLENITFDYVSNPNTIQERTIKTGIANLIYYIGK